MSVLIRTCYRKSRRAAGGDEVDPAGAPFHQPPHEASSAGFAADGPTDTGEGAGSGTLALAGCARGLELIAILGPAIGTNFAAVATCKDPIPAENGSCLTRGDCWAIEGPFRMNICRSRLDSSATTSRSKRAWSNSCCCTVMTRCSSSRRRMIRASANPETPMNVRSYEPAASSNLR